MRLSSVVCLFVLMLWVGTAHSSKDSEYWVTYQKYPRPGQSLGSRYLLRLLNDGSVLLPEKAIIAVGSYGGTTYGSAGANAAAMTVGSKSNVLMWVVDRNNKLVKIRVDDSALKVISITHTKIEITNPLKIQATNKIQDNFISVQKSNGEGRDVLAILPLNSSGGISGKAQEVSAQSFDQDFECLNRASGCGGGSSSDGKIAFYVTSAPHNVTQLFVRALGSLGKPIGQEILVDKLQNELGGLSGIDVSNEVDHGNRLLVYAARRRFSHGEMLDNLYAQFLTRGGKKFGQRIQVKRITEIASGQSVAIDPQGKFILYVDASTNSLMFQPIDSTAHPTAQAKLLSSNVYGGLDILQN